MLGKAIQTELIAKKGNFCKLGVLTASTTTSDEKNEAYWATLEAQGVQIITVDFSDSQSLTNAFTGSMLTYYLY